MPTLETVIHELQRNQERLGIQLNPPATEAQILELEQALGRPLPPDVAAFYRYCNGFETDDDLIFRFGSIGWILDFSEQIAEHRFEIADYMISSDTWDIVLDPLDMTRYRIVNANHGREAEVTLTTSLAEFICRYLNADDGLPDLWAWYEEVKRQQLSEPE